MSLSPADALKLCKILGMCSSSFAGERANAGAQATAFLRERNLQWSDVITVKVLPKPKPKPSPMPAMDDVAKVMFGAKHLDRLTQWEAGLVYDVANRPWRPLTEKQSYYVDKIARKLWAQGLRP